MYELIKISEHDYYIDCPAKIGVVLTGDNEAVLIDSGSDKDAGKKILKIFEENGWKLKAVFNTHSHADHIGGNKLLQDRIGCKVYANELEAAYTQFPQLEPAGLYGGLPFKELQSKFLMAQPSDVLPLTPDVLPAGFEILRLPGHSFAMVGFKTPDGTAYIADSVSSQETLEKYGIGYLWNPKETLETLEYLKTIEAKCFVPAHAPVTEDIKKLADININAVVRVNEAILDICAEPLCFEEILRKIFENYQMNMTAQQYVLIGSTIRSYLSSLYTEGKLTYSFENSRMLWKTV